MDFKVKQMIKLLEEDADSFARRAEMYYKKRPELMKLVEEFYRAYRGLAERYDHATGALRQAHRTMAEAFPNQVPLMLGDDSPVGSATDVDPRTPDMPPIHARFDPDELQKDALGVSPSHRNGAFTEESDSVPGRKGLKRLNYHFGSGDGVNHAKIAEGGARQGLSFHDPEEKEQGVQNDGSHDFKAQVQSQSERVSQAELEILTLKNVLAKLEAEKEAGLRQYELSLERLSNLESEVSRATEDSRGLNERASKSEAEVITLKEALAGLEAEKESSFLQYQHCLEKISNLENSISHVQKDAGEQNERASKAETEAQSLKQDLARLEAEKNVVLVQYKQSLEKISDLEDQLLNAQEDARRFSELAGDAEREIETLKQALTKLTEEKEAAVTQYQQCLATIVSLEHKITCFEEEAKRLNSEIDDGAVKLKDAEERCILLVKSNQTMQSELESLVQKVAAQNEEVTEKQKELGRLWTCVQEERLRFMEAETAFQTLQHLHSQSQEELRSMAAQLQNRAHILEDLEACNQSLKDEVEHVKVENKNLSEVNLSSALTVQNLQDEISSLRETITKLEEEVELRVDQRNALQQEIYCLKEELNDLNRKHQAIVGQVESVGFSPESFGLSVKDLQNANIKLKEVCEQDRSEKVALLEKLEIMEKLNEKNVLLENSLSDLNVELEGIREKVKALEESCQSLLGEKSVLVSEKALLASELQFVTDNLEKLTEKNNILENLLFAANAELEGLRVKSKSLEDLCLLHENEKSDLAIMKGSLTSQLDVTEKSLKDLEKNHKELEDKYSLLEKERESTLHEVQELQVSLDAEKQEHANLAKFSESQLVGLVSQIRVLQEEGLCRKKEYEEELDKAVKAEIEIFILQKSAQDLEQKNFSLLLEHLKLLEASKLSEKQISDLKHENCEQEVKVKCISDQIITLRVGLYQVLKALELDANQCENKTEQDQNLVNHVLNKLQETQEFLFKMQDENQQLVIDNSVLFTLLGQLQLEVENLLMTKNILDQELTDRSKQFLVLQNESQKLSGINDEMRLKLIEGEHKEEASKVELSNLRGQLSDLQGALRNLQELNCKVLDEQRSLKRSFSDLQMEKCKLEEENQQLVIDNSVLFTLLGQLQLEVENLVMTKNILDQEFSNRSEQFLILQNESQKLSGINDELTLKLIEGEHKEEASKVELSNLRGQLSDLQGALRNLQELNCKVLDEQRSLKRSFSDLQMEKCKLEEENQQLVIDNSVLFTLLGQLQLEVENLVMTKNILDQELSNRSEQFLVLQNESQKLSGINDELKLKLIEGEHKEEASKVELSNLCGQLSDLQGALRNLQELNCKVLDEQRSLMKSFSDLQIEKCKLDEENQQLVIDNSVLFTLLGQLQLEVENLLMTKNILDQELTNRSKQFLVLQNESQKLSGINDEMKLKLIEGEHKEEALKVELSNLRGQLSDLQGALRNLQVLNCKVLDEQRSLKKSFSDLQMEKCKLEEENCCILYETVSQSTLSLIFRDIIYEKSVETKNLGENLDKLYHDNNGLNEKVKMLEEELYKLSSLEDDKRELSKMVEDLKCKYDEVEMIQSNQELQIIKLSGDYDQKRKEAENFSEVNQKLESEMRKLHEEFQEIRAREENLSNELVKGRNEIELQESQAVALFSELQIHAVREALFEGKLHELLELCESLEDRNCSKDIEINQLKERVGTLEGGNVELKALMAAYFPAFMSLRECVTSLEKHTLSDATFNEVDNKEPKDAAMVAHAESCQQMSGGQSGPGGTLDFQELQRRVRAIEKAVIEKEGLAVVENLRSSSKLEAAMRQIEVLKSGSSLHLAGVETRKYAKPKPEEHEELRAMLSDDLRQQKQTHEICEDGSEVMTKDIMLDQISECSSYGISRRETMEDDHQILEIWETANRNDNLDLTVGKTQKQTASQAKKKHIRQHPSAESMIEKEVGVDKLEISKTLLSGSSQEANERKILERLDSDAQKLTNLQITVQDLKSKVEITEKSKKGKGIEYDNVKEQLEESEEAIAELLELNRKLMNTVEDESLSFDEKSALTPDESGSVRRRKISEQARRGSENIGRLQLEVQKLQFLLLKLDGENRSRGKTQITERKTRVLLRDYLYGGTRSSQKQKKGRFCSCVQPPTKGD
ncbi:hypothetical protein SADUNF_Sadunf05G0157600 [Salix dunnii]|uniref:NAB domain-containing protein n=1 Tax=Salix dunnii TaxID=1413687 RepID=A0A835KBM8_9ROSI|nr:hypothetical protein SADUNF_Sadunf05G0157600 [Salix dunnii]